jgi:putative addiction module CopG family antidote
LSLSPLLFKKLFQLSSDILRPKLREGLSKNDIPSGRYGSASEMMRDALSAMEERKSKLKALRAHLSEGAIKEISKCSTTDQPWKGDHIIRKRIWIPALDRSGQS